MMRDLQNRYRIGYDIDFDLSRPLSLPQLTVGSALTQSALPAYSCYFFYSGGSNCQGQPAQKAVGIQDTPRGVSRLVKPCCSSYLNPH